MLVDGQMHPDETEHLIERLLSDHLLEVAVSEAGWETLYRDRRDNTLWELSYHSSALHGGGARTLAQVTQKYASHKFRI